MEKYIRRYSVVEAVQLMERNKYEVAEWCGERDLEVYRNIPLSKEQDGCLFLTSKTGKFYTICSSGFGL